MTGEIVVRREVVERKEGRRRAPRKRNGDPRPPRSQARTKNESGLISSKVYAPQASGQVRKMQNPRFIAPNPRKGRNGDIIVAHREYITDISGSVLFASNSVPINPGLNGSFPWLSGVAQRFESYRFTKLRFCFETESPNTTKGTVLLTNDYDPSDAAPTSKSQAMAYRSAVRSPPWSDSCLQAIKEDLEKRATYFVRQGNLSANQDIKLYDVGNHYVCTQGQADTSVVGELYVEYECMLMTPQLNAAGGGESISGSFTGSSNALPFGSTAFNGNLPVGYSSTGTTSSVTTFTFTQPWSGYVTLALNGTGLTGITPSGTATVASTQTTINAGATAGINLSTVNATIGQTFVYTLANTTITLAILTFGQSNLA